MKFLGSEYLINNSAGIKIFKAIRQLPIVDMHNHANVVELAQNRPCRDLWQVMGESDHYVWEAMRGAGVKENFITGGATPHDKFTALCDIFPMLIGNPVYEWLHLDLRRIFGVELLLNRNNGEKIWQQCNAMLQTEEFLPLNLLRRMNVELMCSTDDPVDLLQEHAKVNKTFGS
ncbi:MAG: glucuronate isomerase, partial [Victivallaceae bacterium]